MTVVGMGGRSLERTAPPTHLAAENTNDAARSTNSPPTPPVWGWVEPSSHDQGVDVLTLLVALRSAPFVARSAALSNNLFEASQRAAAYPNFASLAARTDGEGLFEAAAWAMACSMRPLPDRQLRCTDERLREKTYADALLFNAAMTGHPAAVLEWIGRHPVDWVERRLPNGDMFRDRLFALAAHGDVQAMEAIKQWCALPSICVDGPFVQNVLTVLQIQLARKDWDSAYTNDLQGDVVDRKKAVERGTQLRQTLSL